MSEIVKSIKNPEKEFLIFTLYSIIFVFIVFFISLLIKYYPVSLFAGAKYTDDFWYLFVLKIGFLFAAPLFIYKKCNYSVKKIFKRKIGFSVLIFLLAGCLLNFSYIPKIMYAVTWNNSWKVLLGILIPLITAAIPEEVFYRFILQTRAEIVCGTFKGVVLTAFLFALFHFPSRFLLSSGVEGIGGNVMSIVYGTIIPVFILGMIFGFIWKKYRNIYFIIALHFGIDLFPSVASLLGIVK